MVEENENQGCTFAANDGCLIHILIMLIGHYLWEISARLQEIRDALIQIIEKM